MFPNVRCSNCEAQKEKTPGLKLDCDTPEGCPIPEVSAEIKRSIMIRQDLFRLKEMGWPDLYRYEYIKHEYNPDLYLMQLSMLADEIIVDIQNKLRQA